MELMTSRERVLASISHKPFDRAPIDLGSTIMTGIMASALTALREKLGLGGTVRIHEIFQMLGEVEMDVVERLGVDVLPVSMLKGFFDIKREHYKPFRLFSGEEVLVPGQFNICTGSDGQWMLHEGGDATRPIVAKMPQGGYYFDAMHEMTQRMDFAPPPLSEIAARYNCLNDEELDYLGQRARWVRENTDKAAVLEAVGATGLSHVGSLTEFLMLMATDVGYVKEMLELESLCAVENLKLLKQAVGDMVDVVVIDGFDYGTQKAELFSPDIFREIFMPAYRRQCDWVHANTCWKTWKHSCGSIAAILPMLIDAGIDIINPVQCSAAGMDAETLKNRFGRNVVFWGGGSDTQKTLPFGTPDEVRREVIQQIKTLGKGGGFVFCAVHNIQAKTPVENIVAAYETAKTVELNTLDK